MDWISVDDRMPKNTKSILAWGTQSSPYTGHRTEVYKCSYSKCNNDWVLPRNYTLEDVTHWMPIPKPPIAPSDQ